MSSPINGFNLVAGVYDALARIVFGRQIRESQEFFLSSITDRKKILILGGGSGWILKSLEKVGFNGEVWYVEASSEMIIRSRKKSIDKYHVHFIHGTEDDVPTGISFDAVVTDFYLDLFPADKLSRIIKKLTSTLTPDALWLATDFVRTESWWHIFLLRTMYFFFRITSGIQARELPEWSDILASNNLIKIETKTFYRGFIKSLKLRYLPST